MIDGRVQHCPAVLSAARLPGEARPSRASSIGTSRDELILQSDAELLQSYNASGCNESFSILVERHLSWIDAMIRRKVRDKHLAEDITQAVFIILARKAKQLNSETVLSAWLFRVARFAIRDAIKQQMRHDRRVQRVAEQQIGRLPTSAPAESSSRVDLDDALACLTETDRLVILLRFYEEMSMAQVAASLGITEISAKQRVSRALKRLRKLIARNQAAAPTTAMLVALLGIMSVGSSSTSAASISQVAMGATGSSGASSAIAQSTLHAMTRVQSKIWSAMSGSLIVALVAVGVFSPAMGQGVVRHIRDKMIRFMIDLSPGSIVNPKSEPSDSPAPSSPQKLWLSRPGGASVQIYPLRGPSTPLVIRSTRGSTDPVAVAMDDAGSYWVHPINAEPATANLIDRWTRQGVSSAGESNRLGFIDAGLQLFEAGALLQNDNSDWHLIGPASSDGSIVLQFNLTTPESKFADTLPPALVPEPIGLLSLAGASLLLIRRSRR